LRRAAQPGLFETGAKRLMRKRRVLHRSSLGWSLAKASIVQAEVPDQLASGVGTTGCKAFQARTYPLFGCLTSLSTAC
jgi:hypothetical protein